MDRAGANDREWPAPVRDGLLFAAVVFSGAGGLIYQLAWTRWLASITSATHTGLARTIYCGMGCATVAAIIAAALQVAHWKNWLCPLRRRCRQTRGSLGWARLVWPGSQGWGPRCCGLVWSL